MMRRRGGGARIGLFACGLMFCAGTAAAAAPADAGAAIYLRGQSGSGAPIEANQLSAGLPSRGPDAACVNCHLHSGLGAREGHIAVPPISGRYLFRAHDADHASAQLPYVEGMRRGRQAYNDLTLARAIREGVDADGKPLGALMPRFALDDRDMAALIDYLKALDQRRVPGVTDTVLHFATIITPDADPQQRSGMLAVMQQYFTEKNTRVLRTSPTLRSSDNTAYSKTMYMVNRRWQLHVWQLQGPPGSWEEQLRQDLAREPVFAVVSGLGAGTWAPVHAFCERARLPCLFPNVEVPVVAESDFYSLYFSKGVLLEAELIAEEINKRAVHHPVTALRQVYRAGDSGAAAARQLAARLAGSGIALRSIALPAHGVLADATGALAPGEALVLWLRPADIAALGPAPSGDAAVFLSGLMGGLERAPLPSAWRPHTAVTYPFDLPEHRGVRLDYALGWFRIRNIAVVAEQVQADTYLACGLLAETLSHMVDTFVRDYLVERAEENLEHRIMTGYYPRLSLSEGERFASKGGYLARFDGAAGDGLVADSAWTVP